MSAHSPRTPRAGKAGRSSLGIGGERCSEPPQGRDWHGHRPGCWSYSVQDYCLELSDPSSSVLEVWNASTLGRSDRGPDQARLEGLWHPWRSGLHIRAPASWIWSARMATLPHAPSGGCDCHNNAKPSSSPRRAASSSESTITWSMFPKSLSGGLFSPSPFPTNIVPVGK